MAAVGWGPAVPVWLAEDDLGCIICQELLKCPTTLPCGHSFCRKCLKALWKKARPDRWGLCPTCRETLKPEWELRKNTMLQELVDKYRQAERELNAPPRATAPDPAAAPAPPQPQPEAQKSNSTDNLELTELLEEVIDIVRKLQSQPGQEDEPKAPDLDTSEMPGKKMQFVLYRLEELQGKLRENFKCRKALEQPAGEQSATLSSSSHSLPDQKGSAPKRTSRFAQYAVHPTFDGKSLCHRLLVSMDGHTVKVSDSQKRYPWSPERFRVCQAFCSQAFKSGQQYWEVDTQCCSYWCVGVASWGMSRDKMLGRSMDSWCVEWKGTNRLSGWCKCEETDLGSYRPRVVGVWLDFEECILSFYSVEDQEKLLYECPIFPSFTLYPAFWLYGLDTGNRLTIRPVET